MGWTIEDSEFDSLQVKRFVSSPQRRYRLWDPASLLSNQYGGVKFTPSNAEIKNGGAIPRLPIRRHAVMLNVLSAGVTVTCIYVYIYIYIYIYTYIGEECEEYGSLEM
jgi:hypothetical protein